MLAVGAWLAASHVRMLFVFGILAAPIVSRLFSTTWDGYNAERDHPVPNAVFIAVALLVVCPGFSEPSESGSAGGGAQSGKSSAVHQSPPSFRANAE